MDFVTSVGCSKAFKKKTTITNFSVVFCFDEIARLSLDESGII